MSASISKPTTRREFIKNTSRVAAASALAGVVLPHVHAAEDNTIRLALIGTGGRGSGAVANAMQSPNGPVKVVAMADLYQDRLFRAHTALTKQFGERIDVPTERQFIGFDAYKKAIDCLRPGKGDVAMLTGYAGFRPSQLEYAVEKGVNVFMEKSFAADPPGARRVIKAGEAAAKKNLKIAAGLMCRHARSRQELVERIHGGELGEILLLRAYRMQPVGPLAKRPAKENELQWQIRHFTSFFWVSGGLFAEMNIHQIDELCWIKNALPVTAHGVGGRAANSTDCSQNLDSIAIEWTFPDGTKATDTVRWLPKCYDECTTYVHGTKRAAQFPGSGHPGPVVIHKDQRTTMDNVAWRAKQEPYNAWDAEWNVLLDAIRNNKPHNEAKRAAMSNLADMMGRAAVHMGRIVTWDEVMKSNFQFFPKIDELTNESEPPFHENAEGRYPVPVPGIWTEI